MQSGKWADIDDSKCPSLRGLSARAPYFHQWFGGHDYRMVFYYDRNVFSRLNSQEADDLIAFLS